MNEEHSKLIAKIQHFYDLMATRSKEIFDDSILNTEEGNRNKSKEVAIELSELLLEYSKVFQEFIYKDNQ